MDRGDGDESKGHLGSVIGCIVVEIRVMGWVGEGGMNVDVLCRRGCRRRVCLDCSIVHFIRHDAFFDTDRLGIIPIQQYTGVAWGCFIIGCGGGYMGDKSLRHL